MRCTRRPARAACSTCTASCSSRAAILATGRPFLTRPRTRICPAALAAACGLPEIYAALEACDLFVTVGSSGAVHPAAGFVSHLRHTPNPRGRFARCIYVGLERPDNSYAFDECRLGKAGDLLPSLFHPT